MVTPFKIEMPLGRGGRRQRARRPYRQGDLDGLCGVYSVINALRAVCPELTTELSSRLFKQLMRCLRGRAKEPLDVVSTGLGRQTLGRLLKVAMAFVARRLRVTVKARRLPKPVRTTYRLDRLWRELTEVLSPTSVAIIGLAGRTSHWTVATRIGPKHLFLLDSGNMKRVRRTHCTVGWVEKLYSIDPGEVIVVERA